MSCVKTLTITNSAPIVKVSVTVYNDSPVPSDYITDGSGYFPWFYYEIPKDVDILLGVYISGGPPGTPAPTGTVTFKREFYATYPLGIPDIIGTVAVIPGFAAGTAQIHTTFTALNDPAWIYAIYSGDAYHNPASTVKYVSLLFPPGGDVNSIFTFIVP